MKYINNIILKFRKKKFLIKKIIIKKSIVKIAKFVKIF